MSELTFNIADYRPLGRVNTHKRAPGMKERTGFVVFSSHSEPREYQARFFDPRPVVVDIGSLRETRRTSPRRGKILRFSNPASHRVYTMPAHQTSSDDDPGPMVA